MVWAKVGLLSFGGPAGQIATMHDELVVRRRWLDEARFLHALNYCMLLPGPEAQQLAIYIGWLMHRTRGGVAAGLLFVIPGFISVLGLSLLYVRFHELPAVAAVFWGLKAAIVAVVASAVVRIGKRALVPRKLVIVAALAFVLLFFFSVGFAVIVVGAGAFGVAARCLYKPTRGGEASQARTPSVTTVVAGMAARGELGHTEPNRARAARVLAVCTLAWAAPLLLVRMTLGPDCVWLQEGVFFSKASVLTFGGAYAVLAYVAQAAVVQHGWLTPGEMLDGLGLAETTPGPLILVSEFVGFLAAYRQPGGFAPWASGVLGACMTVWVNFAPCFLWVFLGGPYMEALRSSKFVQAALASVSAAVVGVILNISLWFGLHVLFRDVRQFHAGAIHCPLPIGASLDVAALALVGLALLLLVRVKLSVPKMLGISAVLGCVWKLTHPLF
jgi:chromate transporter